MLTQISESEVCYQIYLFSAQAWLRSTPNEKCLPQFLTLGNVFHLPGLIWIRVKPPSVGPLPLWELQIASPRKNSPERQQCQNWLWAEIQPHYCCAAIKMGSWWYLFIITCHDWAVLWTRWCKDIMWELVHLGNKENGRPSCWLDSRVYHINQLSTYMYIPTY